MPPPGEGYLCCVGPSKRLFCSLNSAIRVRWYRHWTALGREFSAIVELLRFESNMDRVERGGSMIQECQPHCRTVADFFDRLVHRRWTGVLVLFAEFPTRQRHWAHVGPIGQESHR